MRVAFHNLGCKVNSYELDIVRQSFLDAGYEEFKNSPMPD